MHKKKEEGKKISIFCPFPPPREMNSRGTDAPKEAVHVQKDYTWPKESVLLFGATCPHHGQERIINSLLFKSLSFLTARLLLDDDVQLQQQKRRLNSALNRDNTFFSLSLFSRLIKYGRGGRGFGAKSNKNQKESEQPRRRGRRGFSHANDIHEYDS